VTRHPSPLVVRQTINRLPHYTTLLVALFADVVLSPLVLSLGIAVVVARLIMAAVLVAALLAVGPSLGSVAAFATALIALVLSWFWTTPLAISIDLLLRMAFVGYVATNILLRVLRQEEVTVDTIAGAACVYVMLGLLWAIAYELVEHLVPGSFDIPDGWRVPHGQSAPALVYFSFVTLTTVGFGDVRAAGPAAGGLVMVEAIVGQLFIAITVARLVGLHIARR
jgi:voltage-gated potassium channel